MFLSVILDLHFAEINALLKVLQGSISIIPKITIVVIMKIILTMMIVTVHVFAVLSASQMNRFRDVDVGVRVPL